LLSDLAKQTYQNFEVIVVDGQSDDETVAKAKAALPSSQLTVVTAPERNVSVQRNLGAQTSRGEWIIFMDADNRLPRYFLEGVSYRTHQHPKVNLFTTWMKVDGSGPKDRAIERVMNTSIELYRRIGKPSALGALIGCKRRVMQYVKFDPTQKFTEDGYFIQAAVTAGFTFAIWADPHFIYSLRRVRREGFVKMLSTVAALQLKYLQNHHFDNAPGYPMLGGSYYESYEQTAEHLPAIRNLHDFLHQASQQQRVQARKVLKGLKQTRR
jgi:glycosyltransferase involved in cell wall biosynthesis